MSNQSILRITREIGDIQKSSDLSLDVQFRDMDVRHVRALIIGPPETPYEFGFFEFALKFSSDYPNQPPQVTALTTNGGRTRFNPNIYAMGKVCLSILGTWRGTRGEEWSSAQSLESILISIQSLMSSNPYENEPGFEDCRSDSEKKDQEEYAAKIRHESLRISVIERLEDCLGLSRTVLEPVTRYTGYDANKDANLSETTLEAPWSPFADLCKRRFLWYYDSYLLTIEKEAARHFSGKKFERMPFEGSGNGMDGEFSYTKLKTRLSNIHEALEKEATRWVADGKRAQQRELISAGSIERQFVQTSNMLKDQKRNVEIEKIDDNPFHWRLVVFGRPMTNFDGGIFPITMRISTKFPDEQPRVKFETPIFHQRISNDGFLCYVPRKPEDMKTHIEAILDSIEDEAPGYDPRTMVNPEAARLFWGTPEEKKVYNRRLRRSVQDSLESSF